MSTDTDERRARAMQQAIRLQLTLLHLPEHQATRIDRIANNLSSLCAMIARTSDEAAGMVEIPASTVEFIKVMVAQPVSSYSVEGLDRIFERVRAMIAATEAEE